MDPSEKDALLRVPGAGLTMAESMGMADKSQRFLQYRRNERGGRPRRAEAMRQSQDEFSRIELMANILRPPPVKFKDLEALSTSRLVRDQVKFDYRFDFLRITSDTVLVPITVQIPVRQLSFQEKDGVDSASMNVFARITTLSGRVVQTFEDTLRADFPVALAAEIARHFQDLSEGRAAEPRALPAGYRDQGRQQRQRGRREHPAGRAALPGRPAQLQLADPGGRHSEGFHEGHRPGTIRSRRREGSAQAGSDLCRGRQHRSLPPGLQPEGGRQDPQSRRLRGISRDEGQRDRARR